MTIGEKIRSFGLSKFNSLNEFAEAMGMKPPSLHQYLGSNAKREPGTGILIKLKKLGCDIDWLLTEKYTPLPSKDNSVKYIKPQFRIEASIPAGQAEIQDLSEWSEYEDLYFDPQEHFYLKVDTEFGYSMMPLVNPGDLVLVSFSAKVKDGDLVAARWDKTKGALKIYKEKKKKDVVLLSYNQAVDPIFLSKDEVEVYKVVLIKKKK